MVINKSHQSKISKTGLKSLDDKNTYKKGREKLLQDYLRLYNDSGILGYFSKRIKQTFEIPVFYISDDLYLDIQPLDDAHTFEEEKSKWYEKQSQQKKEAIRSFIKSVIADLYLPGSSYTSLFHYFLYGDLKAFIPSFDEYMIDCIAFGKIPKDEILGYTKSELKKLSLQSLFYLEVIYKEKVANSSLPENEKSMEIAWTDTQIQLIPFRCAEILKNLKRKNRPLKTLELDIQIINLLRNKYKKLIKDEDFFATGKRAYRIAKYKDIILDDLFPNVHINKVNKKTAWYRSRVRDLKRKYPFLEDFIKTSDT